MSNRVRTHRSGPHGGRRRLGAAVEGIGRIERFDLPRHPPAVPGIDLVVAGERDGTVGAERDEEPLVSGRLRGAHDEREAPVGTEVQIGVVDVGDDAVRPLPR